MRAIRNDIRWLRPGHVRALAAIFILGFFATLHAAANPSIRVLYPNGGEKFHTNETITIRWEAIGVDGEVEVEYSDAGQWRRVERTDAAAGSLSWTIKRTGDAVQVRVSTRDGDVSDMSDGTFLVELDPLEETIVFAPNGGEVWTEGEKHTITWQVPPDAIDVTLEYSTNGIWKQIATVPATPASYEWTAPNVGGEPATTVFVKVSVAEALDHFDQSNAPFTIKPKPVNPATATIALIYPNGGERIAVDSLITIRWTAKGVVGSIDVDYSADGGGTWSSVARLNAGVQSLSWTAPTATTDSALLRVRTIDGKAGDSSDAIFAIIAKTQGGGPQDTLDPKDPVDNGDDDDDDEEDIETTVLTPNGGEAWIEGETHGIQWEAPADVITVSIELSTDGGNTWVEIDTAAAATGRYDWLVSRLADTVITQAIMRVTDLREAKHFDISDATFSIAPKSDVVAGVERGATGVKLLGVFPNPTSGPAEIRWMQGTRSSVAISIYDRHGALARRIALGLLEEGEQRAGLELGDLPNGLYLYEVSAGDGAVRGALTLMR